MDMYCKSQIFNEIGKFKNKKSLHNKMVNEFQELKYKGNIHYNYDLSKFCLNYDFKLGRNIINDCTNIDYLDTIPNNSIQFILGRVDVIKKTNYSKCKYFSILDLKYPEEISDILNTYERTLRYGEEISPWSIELNDIFIYCSYYHSKSLPFGKFLIRLVLDKTCSFENDPYKNNSVCLTDYRYSPDRFPSVTIRELCQLLNIYKYSIFKRIPYEGFMHLPYEIYFLSRHKKVPNKFKSMYKKIEINTINTINI